MKRRCDSTTRVLLFVLAPAAFAIACSGGERRSGFRDLVTDRETTSAPATSFGEVEKSASACEFQDDVDHDGDGLSFEDGDCNDCHVGVHPGLFDVSGNGADEDCSDTPDDGDAACDDSVEIEPGDPYDAAKTMGLCRRAKEGSQEWGLLDARFVRPDGTTAKVNLDVGALKKFGVNTPRQGSAILAISTGYARAPGDPGYPGALFGTSRPKTYPISHGVPDGYPKEFAGCPDGTEKTGAAYDGIGLEVRMRVPKNARSFSYEQNFFTSEYSTYICTKFNDFFVALLQPKLPSLPDENIAFDSLNNPISVNNGLLEVCWPGTYKEKEFTCPLGTGPLKGTGFDNGAATGWLTTSAPVKGGSEITLRFAVWDSGDGGFDSTVLLDNFRWSADETGAPQTTPIPK